MKVIARTSAFAFKGQHGDIRRIADALGVSTVLEGSVRRSGSRLRVTAVLITAADGSHLWSERYDREMTDVFAIQDDIASAIATALRIALAGGSATHTPALRAYEALLRGRHHRQRLTPSSLVLARDVSMKPRPRTLRMRPLTPNLVRTCCCSPPTTSCRRKTPSR